MLAYSDEALSVLTGSYRYQVRVSAWRQGVLLAADIPVTAGTLEDDTSLRVPERLTLTVPAVDATTGTVYAPVADSDPLAAAGQHLIVSAGIELVSGTWEYLQLGEYLITDSTVRGETVSVEATGLLAVLDEARLITPVQPDGTLGDAVETLVGSSMPISITGLTDRDAPGSMSWDQDRLDALLEILDAWPATGRVSSAGVLEIGPAGDSVTAVAALTDAAGGTVITWAGSSTRDGCNAAVARGTTSEGTQVQGVVYDTEDGSPTRYGGPWSPLAVPIFFFSPLLTTVAQCRAAAATILARRRRSAARRVVATIPPHPGLRTGDRLTVTSDRLGLDAAPAILDAYALPLTADGGPATATCRLV